MPINFDWDTTVRCGDARVEIFNHRFDCTNEHDKLTLEDFVKIREILNSLHEGGII